jgi:NADH dehydrogenase FAD-containing subunit
MNMPSNSAFRSRIVIIGGGSAGIALAAETKVQVVLIDKHNYQLSTFTLSSCNCWSAVP